MVKPNVAMKVPQVERDAVTVTGNDLLKLIQNNGGMYLLPSEAGDIIAKGFAAVDENDLEGDAARVTLTSSGIAALTAAPTRGKVKFAIDENVPMVETKKESGRRGSKYPFDDLQPSQSFHVAKTANTPNPLASLASSLTVARRRYEVPATDMHGKPVMETIKTKNYKLDASGKRIKADGKFVVEGEQTIQRQKRISNREFTAYEVSANDPRGVGARVYRTK